jgi:hypothetical protein
MYDPTKITPRRKQTNVITKSPFANIKFEQEEDQLSDDSPARNFETFPDSPDFNNV